MKKYNWIDVMDTALESLLRLRIEPTPVVSSDIEFGINHGLLADPRRRAESLDDGHAHKTEYEIAWLVLAIEADEDNITDPIRLHVDDKDVTIEDGKKRMRAYEFLAAESAAAHGMPQSMFWNRDIPLEFTGPGAAAFQERLDKSVA